MIGPTDLLHPDPLSEASNLRHHTLPRPKRSTLLVLRALQIILLHRGVQQALLILLILDIRCNLIKTVY